jgi:hypothetical protein
MWGARGEFLLAAAMVVAVVMPVVFCPKATEKRNKNTKMSCLLPKSLVKPIAVFLMVHVQLMLTVCSNIRF